MPRFMSRPSVQVTTGRDGQFRSPRKGESGTELTPLRPVDPSLFRETGRQRWPDSALSETVPNLRNQRVLTLAGQRRRTQRLQSIDRVPVVF